jgi:hypothetical protein
MSIGEAGVRRGLRAGLAILGLVCPAAASADEIRVLFVPSRDPGVDAQVRRLQQAIRETQGPIVITESLTDAHVALQFTECRRTLSEKDGLAIRWSARAKLLKLPDEMTVGAKPFQERFELLVIGADTPDLKHARELLERVLSQTFRPRARAPEKEAI